MIYFLDKVKKVIAKDIPFELLEIELNEMKYSELYELQSEGKVSVSEIL